MADPGIDAMNEPKVFVVVPVFNGVDDTCEFLESLSGVNYRNLDVVVVDDGSTDETGRRIAERFPYVHLLRGDGNLWWAGATNLGVRHALAQGADFILTINNDNEVAPEFLSSLVSTAQANGNSIIKSVAYDSRERNVVRSFGGQIRWWSGHIDERLMDIDLQAKTVEVPLGNGNSTLIPARVFKEVGFYDEVNLPQYHADSDLLLRAGRHGFRVLVDNGSTIYNKAGRSVGRSAIEEMGIVGLLTDRRSPYYFRANRKIYREFCPYRCYWFFLFLRYAAFFKDHVKNRLSRMLHACSI